VFHQLGAHTRRSRHQALAFLRAPSEDMQVNLVDQVPFLHAHQEDMQANLVDQVLQLVQTAQPDTLGSDSSCALRGHGLCKPGKPIQLQTRA